MLNSRLNVATLIAAAGLASMSGSAEVVHRGSSFGYGMGRRSRPSEATGGYPGAKLAKKARKGTLTINGIR